MADIIFSFEHEMLVAGLPRRTRPAGDGEPPPDGSVTRSLLELAAMRLRTLPDAGSENGVFLENGARVYADVGSHLEYSGPECANPYDLVCQVAAANRIVSSLAQALAEARNHLREVVLSLVNVDYSGSTNTWGAHESYSHRCPQERLRGQVLPFLASRPVLVGGGGFDNVSPGIRFAVSPRALHLQHEVGSSSMNSRPMFHTRDESLCIGTWKRWHNLTGEANLSHSSTLLKFGCTALVVAAIDAGMRPGDGVRLASPLGAARGWAIEPDASMPLAGGQQVRAADVQRHYLEQVRLAGERHRLPDWAGELCDVWGGLLDLYDTDPDALKTILDWKIKEAVYQDVVDEAGFGGQLSRWNAALYAAQPWLRAEAEGERREWALAHADDPSACSGDGAQQAAVAAQDLDPARLPEFFALRARLFEMDTRYGQLGPQGLFSDLDRAGVLHHRLPGCDDLAIERARTEPPNGTRAKVRGAVVRRLATRRHACRCYWHTLSDGTGQHLNLGDPFCQEERWSGRQVEAGAW